MKLSNEIAAVVTGGASGLGEATVRRLAAEGVRCAIFDLNEELGEAVAKEVGGTFCKVDVSDPDSVAAGFAAARAAHGQERIAINCAGVGWAAKTVDRDGNPHKPDLFATVVKINLIGTFNVASQAAAGIAAALGEVGAAPRAIVPERRAPAATLPAASAVASCAAIRSPRSSATRASASRFAAREA